MGYPQFHPQFCNGVSNCYLQFCNGVSNGYPLNSVMVCLMVTLNSVMVCLMVTLNYVTVCLMVTLNSVIVCLMVTLNSVIVCLMVTLNSVIVCGIFLNDVLLSSIPYAVWDTFKCHYNNNSCIPSLLPLEIECFGRTQSIKSGDNTFQHRATVDRV